jgi:2-(1,2-epoxy-1,2-dihydrophenyl)acetyl-CoA isomerase
MTNVDQQEAEQILGENTEPILLENEGALARITLNRPNVLNAMNESMMDSLIELLRRLDQDSTVRAVLLRGAGRAFSAGGDVKLINIRASSETQYGSLGATIERRRADLVRRGQASALLQTMSKPVVAALQGHVVGGAVALALACDLRIAADDIKLRIGFASRSLSGDYGISYLLERGVGLFRARELMMLDEPINAEQALKEGLVTEVVPRSQLESRAEEVAQRLAAGPTIALGRMKANLAAVASATSLDQFLETEALNQRISALTEDSAESGKAFVERRLPKFTGR